MQREHRRPILLACACALLACVLLPASASTTARATGTLWQANRPGDDATNGDAAAHAGSLRFVLAHAAAGDTVRIGDVGEFIDVASTLVVPEQVTVGALRDEPCGSYKLPLVNIRATDAMSPVLRLGAGATLRNLDIVGGKVGVLAAGGDVDVCGVGIGVAYEPGADPPVAIPEVKPPSRAALIVDGERTTIHQNYLNGAVVVSAHGSDTRIGDTPNGTGDGNAGVRAASVSVLSNGAEAARRVTIRDPFPRALYGIVGSGIAGGDDVPGHANAWAQTPTITSATTSDGFASVQVVGMASPGSLVDVFFDTLVSVERQSPITAGTDGAWSFSGPLPGNNVKVFAVSTLVDATHPQRFGSSSQFSNGVQVTVAGEATPTPTPSVTPVPAEPLLSALGSAAVVGGAPQSPARPGDTLRFQVTITNIGSVAVTNVNSTLLQLPKSTALVTGSGALVGGSGFSADDSGFRSGTIAPGAVVVYRVDATLLAAPTAGTTVFSCYVNGEGIIAIPVVARIRVAPAPTNSTRSVFLPFIVGPEVRR